MTYSALIDLFFVSDCDWETKGVAVLDMTDVVWGSVFNVNDEPYQVPTAVVNAIGGR